MSISDTVIIIPARMQASRLPGKPLADIAGKAMILHVMERAMQANLGQVYVACAEQEIADVVHKASGKAIITDPHHASGSDRIFEALTKINDSKVNYIINLQGDLPIFDPKILQQGLALIKTQAADIVTFAAIIKDNDELNNPNNVKIAISFEQNKNFGRALYFSRSPIPFGANTHYHHIGIYIYKLEALKKFIKSKVSVLELSEKLEQLRALENNMTILTLIVDSAPIGVDTYEDLAQAKLKLENAHTIA